MPQALLFDLDGTLVDSVEDIAAAANAVRVDLGAEALPQEKIRTLIGDGARKLMERVVADLEMDPRKALSDFRMRYASCCCHATRPYPGVVEALGQLDRWPCAVVSNKPQRFTEMVVEGTGLEPYFGSIIGARPDLPVKPDPALLKLAAGELGVELERCWMIGDSPNDLRAARAVGAGAIAVGYGLVDADRLRSEEPDAFLDRFEQLLGYLSIDAIDAAGD